MADDGVQREVLPIPDQDYMGQVLYDAKDPEVSRPAIEPVRPPQGAPNVLMVLIDDVGFGASSALAGHARRRPSSGSTPGGPRRRATTSPRT